MSKSRFISAPESMKVHSFDPGAWSRHMITRARQEESVGLFKVVHGDLFGDVFVIGPEFNKNRNFRQTSQLAGSQKFEQQK